MDSILILTLLLIFAELFEAYIQRASTLLGMLEKLYVYYQKHIFIFLMIQPSFYFILAIVLMTGVLNASMIFLLALKIFDIFYKIELMHKVFVEQQISKDIAQMLTLKIPYYFSYLGLGVYPPLLFFALS